MRRRLMLLAALAVAVAVAIVAPAAHAASPSIVISQVYGGGGNTDAPYTNDFVELFNRGTETVTLDGWSLQYASATGTGNFGANTGQITPLSGAIAPGHYVLVREAGGAIGVELPPPILADDTPINMSATGGKVALTTTTTSLGCNGFSTACNADALAKIVDLVGYGSANFFEGSAPTAAPSNTTSVSRNDGGCTDTDQNAADFTVGSPAPRNFNSDPHTCGTVVDQPVVVTCGGPLTAVQGVGATRAVSATDPDDTVTSLTLTSVTPTPAAGSIALTGVTPATADGGTATATLNVGSTVPPGSYTAVIGAANDDDPAQTASCSVSITVTGVRTIGEVQGATLDNEVGSLDRSPFPPASGNGGGQTVVVRGVITEKTLTKTSAGARNYGFFLQSTPTSSDGDPLTSDGIFVFMGTFTTLIGGYEPQVGDEVVISGRVSEFFSYTELSSASLIVKVGSMLDLDALAPAFAATPPDDFAASERYWERRERMRAHVAAGSVTVDGLDVFPGTADAEQWLIDGAHPVATREDPYTRRVFRDAHPLDNAPGLFDDGNGYRIVLGPTGVKAAADDLNLLLEPARTFETLTNDLVGSVSFTFSKYRIEVTTQPAYETGVDPSANEPPGVPERDLEYTVNDYNVENLYDYRDDPFDGCDFTGNGGCPGVSPPFDYVPASDAVYQARLGEFADQVVNDLHAPDILLVQEAEDQDICTAHAFVFACGAVNNADGKPDTLQELAVRIHDLYGVDYDAAYDRNGADDRGIVAAFLYRADRVELLPADASHPVLGSSPTVDYRGTALPYNTDVSNPKSLNAVLPADVDRSTGTDGNNVYTRAPQVGYFRVWRTAIGVGAWTDLYAISEHFSSTPNARVGQRREQARYSAAIVNALAAADDGSRVAVGGDFNVYPRPDDPFPPPNVSDQLGPLYDEAGMHNLFDTIVHEVPAAAYSYVFQGQTQTLDGQFVTELLLDELVQARNAHVNADYPADTAGDGARGLSDHDPLVARYELRTTVEGLVELVRYYEGTGAITGNNTVAQLLNQLAKGHFEEFAEQVRDKTPRFIDPVAAEALIHEAELLAG